MMFLAIILTLGGSLCFYLASPNQSWLHKQPPGALTLSIGAVLILLAGWAWLKLFSTAAGIFTLLILVMLLLIIFPYLSLIKIRGEKQNGYP